MKRCPLCSRDVPETKRFCGYCGETLTQGTPSAGNAPEAKVRTETPVVLSRDERELQCKACSRTLPKATAKFCRFCGASLAPEAPSHEVTSPIQLYYEPDSGIPWWPLAAAGVILLFTYLATISSNSGSDTSQPSGATASRPTAVKTGTGTPPPTAADSAPPVVLGTSPAGSSALAPLPSTTGADSWPNPQAPFLEGLVAYYRFNGNANDESGYQHHAIPSTGFLEYSTTAVEGRSAFFDGNAYLLVADDPSLRLSQFTLAAWVGATRLHVGNRILEKGNSNGYYLDLDRLGRPVVGFFDGRAYHDLVAPSSVPLTRWAFIVGTFDGSYLRLYIDTALVGEQAVTSYPNATTEPLLIGWKYSGIPEDHFEGFLDEVRIFRRALSATEIGTLHKEAPWVPR